MAIITYDRVVDYDRLPIDAQDVVTRARIVVAAQPTGENRTSLAALMNGRSVPYLPSPIVVEYTAPQHSLFEAERSFELPSGIDPFLPPTHPSIPNPAASGFSDANNVRDGNPETYAALTGSGARELSFNVLPDPNAIVVGYRLAASVERVGDQGDVLGTPPVYAHVRLRRTTGVPPSDLSGTTHAMHELSSSLETAESYAIVPPAQNNELDDSVIAHRHSTVAVGVNALADVPSMHVYEFYPLVLNVPLLQGIAKAQIRLPASNPRRVVVRGYLPPGDRVHTIKGWPGGDYTGVVARQSYVDGNTVVDFEQAGAPLGLSQEAVEAERVRLNRTKDLIRTANYPNLIGRR